MKPKFCFKCGRKTIARDRMEFNVETGEREFDMVCPSGECGHEGHYHEYRSAFFSHKCVKCGISLGSPENF